LEWRNPWKPGRIENWLLSSHGRKSAEEPLLDEQYTLESRGKKRILAVRQESGATGRRN
jgi:hypothetical protein